MQHKGVESRIARAGSPRFATGRQGRAPRMIPEIRRPRCSWSCRNEEPKADGEKGWTGEERGRACWEGGEQLSRPGLTPGSRRPSAGRSGDLFTSRSMVAAPGKLLGHSATWGRRIRSWDRFWRRVCLNQRQTGPVAEHMAVRHAASRRCRHLRVGGQSPSRFVAAQMLCRITIGRPQDAGAECSPAPRSCRWQFPLAGRARGGNH